MTRRRLDADARLLWRFPPRRLAAEEIRDTMLLVAGKLDERVRRPGFPAVRILARQRRDLHAAGKLRPGNVSPSRVSPECSCLADRFASDFDAPDCAFSIARRIPTTTPSQALALMNHSFTIDMAESLAERLSKEMRRCRSGITDQTSV